MEHRRYTGLNRIQRENPRAEVFNAPPETADHLGWIVVDSDPDDVDMMDASGEYSDSEEEASEIDLEMSYPGTPILNSDREDQAVNTDNESDDPPLFEDPDEDQDNLNFSSQYAHGKGVGARVALKIYLPASGFPDSEDEEITAAGGPALGERRSVQIANESKLPFYSIRRIVRLLQRNGVPAMEEDFNIIDDSESELDENERVDWDDIIKKFSVRTSVIHGASDEDKNILGRIFATQFGDIHCKSFGPGAEIWKFPADRTRRVTDRVRRCAKAGGWSDNDGNIMARAFRKKFREDQGVAWRRYKTSLQVQEDPDHLPVVGLNQDYKAWRVVEDPSVDGYGMTPDRYNIPQDRAGEVPMSQYRWFGAEVVTPVYPARSEKTYQNIRKVCGILRDHLRIHKPMEVSTGLHVHLGHKHGWTLLHLKKFVTLWCLIENTLIHTHRRDRGSPRMDRWCGKLMECTNLANAILHDAAGIPNVWSSFRPTTNPQTRARLRNLSERYVPLHLLTPGQRDFLDDLWEYTSIDDLMDGMSGIRTEEDGAFVYVRPAARMRISGSKYSFGNEMQTIEIRTMQGTVDAEHIIHWIRVLERVVYYTRRARDVEFRGTIEQIRRHVHEPKDLFVLLEILKVRNETIQYFRESTNRAYDQESGQEWFVYPDRDRVDWGQPFAVPGYAATHGAQYNSVLTLVT
ncbi:hypothetical protein F4818DRAFT_441950 [Hypoxylon cercidicola]|nr:hypothetical protein F4818DRAFT_441950 [Hypoxylon cercidicola]